MRGLRAGLAGALLAGCGAGTGTAGKSPTEPTCPIQAPPPGWTYPGGPYGTTVTDRFEEFEFQDCDGNPVRFGDVLGDSTVTLFNVSAGWCQPCIEEAEIIESEVLEPYCERGLRVVQVLIEDEEGFPATRLFCNQWKERFGLTLPVLVDPLFETRQYIEAASTPLNMLVTPDGVIRYRKTGPMPADLDLEIEALLAP